MLRNGAVPGPEREGMPGTDYGPVYGADFPEGGGAAGKRRGGLTMGKAKMLGMVKRPPSGKTGRKAAPWQKKGPGKK